jgi:hypothetical protein
MAFTNSLTISGTKFISGDGIYYPIEDAVITTEPLYIKVSTITGNKLNLTATVTFTSQTTGAVVATKSYQFLLDLNGGNPIKQAYEHLKTLSEFADATDC